MIEDIRQIDRSIRVSSREQRELDDKLYSTLSDQYHTVLRSLGKLSTVSTCLTLTNSALVNMLRSTSSEDNMISLDAFTTPTYPTALIDLEKAESVPEFGIILSKRLNSRSVFTDDDGYIKPTVEITRATDNSLFLENPDYVVENRVEHALEGEEPYLARFSKLNMSRSNITFDIVSTDQPFLINSIKYIPMPMAGAVMLERLRYDGINPVVINGGLEFQESSLYNVNRTLPGYIHFEPIETSMIRVAFSSELYNTALNAVTVGISSLAGEYHTYAKTSYIGYKIEYPTGYNTLKTVQMFMDGYALSLSNISLRLYDSEDEFNSMSNRYVISCGVNQQVSITNSGSPLYALIEFESVNNTTPCLSGVDFTFE